MGGKKEPLEVRRVKEELPSDERFVEAILALLNAEGTISPGLRARVAMGFGAPLNATLHGCVDKAFQSNEIRELTSSFTSSIKRGVENYHGQKAPAPFPTGQEWPVSTKRRFSSGGGIG